MGSTLGKQCTTAHGCGFIRERRDDTILWCSESLIPLPVLFGGVANIRLQIRTGRYVYLV